MNHSRYSRRNVLKTLGLAAGFLPLLEAERAVAATASGFPTRFISITWCNGTVFNDFYPPAGPFTAALPPILAALEPYKSKVLAFRSSKGAQSPIDLNVMLDANQGFGGHSAYPALLSGTWKSQQASTGASIDPSTGAWTWTPTAEQAGLWQVTIIATCDGQQSQVVSWRLTVE